MAGKLATPEEQWKALDTTRTQEAVRQIKSSAALRFLFGCIFDEAGLGEVVFTGDPQTHAFNAGRQALAIEIRKTLDIHDASLASALQKELQDETALRFNGVATPNNVGHTGRADTGRSTYTSGDTTSGPASTYE
jgi:hypothetical protein